MEAFFIGLTLFERILFVLASASTALLVVQIILLLIGFSGGDISDASGFDTLDIDSVSGEGVELSMFTVKGFIAFFSVGGWVGLAVSQSGGHILLVLFLALLSGGGALYGVAYLYRLGAKMQSDGTIHINNAIGQIAKVYLTIPAKGDGAGKVTLNLQERFVELEAVTESNVPIKSEEMVRIVGCYENTVIVVKNI